MLLAFSWHFPRLRVPLILGLAGYVMALAIDAFREIDGYVPGAAALLGWTQYSAYHYTKVVEETLELAGTTCFLYAFLGHLLRLVEGRTIRVHRDLDAETPAS